MGETRILLEEYRSLRERLIQRAKVTIRAITRKNAGIIKHTFANEEGEFRFSHLPPGDYVLQSCRQETDHPIEMILEYKRSETLVPIAGDKEKLKVDLYIQKKQKEK